MEKSTEETYHSEGVNDGVVLRHEDTHKVGMSLVGCDMKWSQADLKRELMYEGQPRLNTLQCKGPVNGSDLTEQNTEIIEAVVQ